MTIFALIDCNNFYASCERAFNPSLIGKPIVVLSNNDGCIISRSNEAKQLGIPMGAPFFQWKSICKKNNVHVFSSNYELYGDMSHRVMSLLEKFCPDLEIYSIDEAFLLLDGLMTRDLNFYLRDIRSKVKYWLGLPISIGFAQTKTLAKIANKIAKVNHLKEGFDLCSPTLQEKILAQFPVQDIWGIGSRLTKRLNKLSIFTAKELRDSNPKRMRLHFSVVMEKIIRELSGVSCIPLETIQPRKQIISSRSFGKCVTELCDLEEAISHYAATASLKLRQQKSVCSWLYVFLHTNIFREQDVQYANSQSFRFPCPTADTRYITTIAKKCLQRIYKKGFKYHKTGLALLDLMPQSIKQYDMLLKPYQQKSERLMETVDLINDTVGKNTVFYCAEGIDRPWRMKCDKRSPRYTTSWSELLKVKV